MHDDKEREKLFLPFRVDSLSTEGETSAEYPASESESQTGGGKYTIKQGAQPFSKKNQVKGIAVNQNGRGKLRNNKDIEMRFVTAKPIAQFMNVDSSSLAPKSIVQDSL